MATGGDMDVPALEDNDMDVVDEEEEETDNIVWDDDSDAAGEGNEDLLLGPVKCLFCEQILNSAREVFSHCIRDHAFSVARFCGRWALDCIGYIKLVNFIRTQSPTIDTLKELQPGNRHAPWADDSYMRPADPEDLLLQFDIEAEDCSAGEVPELSAGGSQMPDADSESVVIKASDLQALIQRASEAEAKAAALDTELSRAVSDLNAIRERAKELIAADAPVMGPGRVKCDESDYEDPCTAPVSVLQSLTLKEDEAYFSSYDCTDIHVEMLQDKVRTESYRDFILGNPDVFRDKVVLDVGCGTGILTMFAAKAGASHVIGVDLSDTIYSAMDIARENGLEKKITFLKERMELVTLPYDKVDVIISEWMGYFLLFESMLDTVIVARLKHLAKGGHVYPDKCSMWLAGFQDEELHHRVVGFWDDVYGCKMSCMKEQVIRRTSVDVIASDKMITHPCLIKELDVNTCSVSDLDFESSFTMTCCKDGVLHGLVGYFDIGFEAGCSKQVHFSTGPASPKTHWKQTHFMLKTPIPFTKGTTVESTVKVKKNSQDPRSLDIQITINGRSQHYIMD